MDYANKNTSDLFIVGAGELGARVGSLWRTRHPKATVIGETATAVRHGTLTQLGLNPKLREMRDDEKWPSLLFAVPPSKASQYVEEVRKALRCWSGVGRFVFVSSTIVYAEANGGLVDELSPTAHHGRAAQLLAAENEVIRARGIVIRMAGLYCENRGPHRAYLTTASSPLDAGGYLNLIHYDDAASLCVAALETAEPGTCYLGCDDEPIPRSRLAQLAAQYYKSERTINFLGTEGSLGKRCHNDWTREALSWRPKYPSFEAFLLSERIAFKP